MMPTPTPLPTRRTGLNVFEVVNWSRLESLIVLTRAEPADFAARLRRQPPEPAANWDLAVDRLALEQVATGLPPDDAVDFLRHFLRAVRQPGWTARVWRE